MPSFADVLQRRLRTDPGQPLVTFYDEATGERTELSVTTYANWVAKTAGVLVDDLGLDAGDAIGLELPPHWLVPVFEGAALTVGLTLDDAAGTVVGTTPEATLFCALLPFAVPAREPVATLDFGTLWPSQPDVFLGVADATPLEVASEAGRVLGDPGRFLGLLAGGGSLVIVVHADDERTEAIRAAERAG
ncbi:TIGR03089 family protein [Nocardioides mangrovicus]|uniref:TIGR03089 family protein n=1 Tax=Nocardioides mangrovicus TaxID=2478913 RepID=A0A3L8P3G2_9ACTN|nr:TIGR03089 family protein [Nocardioides mangrovicus]RLV49910.1 TIGR03089 family protein [Nocardioides mangrovicus]